MLAEAAQSDATKSDHAVHEPRYLLDENHRATLCLDFLLSRRRAGAQSPHGHQKLYDTAVACGDSQHLYDDIAISRARLLGHNQSNRYYADERGSQLDIRHLLAVW